jgi:prepilin-type N-terminal cleavage/methylation domain-containing protein/prepilin-type processing-associated H-X9-DG protein
MRASPASRTGFTLVELLVVIAIIGILAALLLPALSWAKAQAHSTTCKNHLRQMGMALQMYVHENGNKYPYYLGPPGPSYGDAIGQGGEATGLVYWSSKLFPYYSLNWTNAAYHCPGYKGASTGPVYAPKGIDRLGSYAYNQQGVDFHNRGRFGLVPVVFWRNAPPVSEAQVKVPSEMFAIGESRFVNAKVNVDAPGGKDYMVCGFLHERFFAFDPARHGKNNQLFCDGHVAGLNAWVLFNPTNTAAMWNYDHQPHPELWVP